MWQKIKNLYHLAQAFFAAVYFQFPSKNITVIGVTGTDGKTTTVNMIYHILTSNGKSVSMISSVSAEIGGKKYDTGFHVSTPNPWQAQKYLNQAKQNKDEYFVLEATSHGLDQNRLAFVNFTGGVLTNITNEHLDYHKTWENYALAKGKLFKKVQFSILNKDDNKSFNFLKSKVGGKVIPYSLKENNNSDITIADIKLKVLGEYNLSNALAAASCAFELGINKQNILEALSTFTGVTGRMEEIQAGQNFRAYVDFAHTPNALEQALMTLRKLTRRPLARLIAVFGAAGNRDSSKRVPMGEVASKYADITILTAEDPRTEDARSICLQIAHGMIGKKEGRDFYIIPDRKDAIQFAVNMAKSGDVVGFFGKGHEKSMCYGKHETPWDEIKAVENAIKKKNEKQ